MNKFNRLNKEVPPTEETFTISIEGELTKKLYAGDFTCRIPRRKDQCMIDKHRAFLNGDVVDQLSPDTLRFHHMIAYLRYTIVDSPKWWKESDLGYDLYDENVVKEVYDAVLKFEVNWLTAVWGEEAVKKLQNGGKDGPEAPEQQAS